MSMIPPGQSPPLLSVDSTHNGALVVIVAALCLTLSLVCLLIRVYVRTYISPSFARDDLVLLGATVFAFTQTGLTFFAVSQGLGTSIELVNQTDVDTVQQLILVTDVLYLATLYLTKCCLVTIFLRLTPNKNHNRASWATFGLSTLWIIPSIIIISANCALRKPWRDLGHQCRDLLLRWQIITALDVATEVFLFFLAIYLMADLHMRLRQKIVVLSAFAFRLPLIAFALLRLHYLGLNFRTSDPTLNLVRASIWTQIELHFSLIALTTFCLKPFLQLVSTNYGTAGDTTLSGSGSGSRSTATKSPYTTDSRTSSNRFALRTIGRSCHRSRDVTNSDLSDGEGRASRLFGTELPSNKTTITRGPRNDNLISNNSRDMIIRKAVEYTVQYEDVEKGRKTGYSQPKPS